MRQRPSRFVNALPDAHIESENSMSGGESLWRANWSERADPFADVARGTGRGPGWQRAAGVNPGGGFTSRTFTREPSRVVEARASAVSIGNNDRSDLDISVWTFHQKFSYRAIVKFEGTSGRSISRARDGSAR